MLRVYGSVQQQCTARPQEQEIDTFSIGDEVTMGHTVSLWLPDPFRHPPERDVVECNIVYALQYTLYSSQAFIAFPVKHLTMSANHRLHDLCLKCNLYVSQVLACKGGGYQLLSATLYAASLPKKNVHTNIVVVGEPRHKVSPIQPA